MPFLSRVFIATAVIAAVIGWVAGQGRAFATRVVTENGPVEAVQGLLLAAVMAGFGGVISEVGSVMMVGGNIKGQTRVLTTAMVLETQMGNFGTAIALGVILLTLSFAVNVCLTQMQQRKQEQWPRRF